MPHTFSRLIQPLFGQLGLQVIPKWRWKTYQLATHTKELFQALQINCVLDVGANKGQYARFLRVHVGYEGEILSFEPVPELASVLEKKAETDPLWKVFSCALGATESSLEINITKGTTLHSFLTPTPVGIDHIDQTNTIIRREVVPVKTVDHILKSPQSNPSPSRRVFLKMDTQGYDSEVLKGAASSIPQIFALQTELSCLHLYEKMMDFPASLSFLQQMGFDITGFFPVNHDKWYRAVEFDCLAINRDVMTRFFPDGFNMLPQT